MGEGGLAGGEEGGGELGGLERRILSSLSRPLQPVSTEPPRGAGEATPPPSPPLPPFLELFLHFKLNELKKNPCSHKIVLYSNLK